VAAETGYDLGSKKGPCAGTKALLIQDRNNLPDRVIIQEPIDLGDDFAVGHACFPSV
jgi:hypothetical protein